ncbi:MAG: hypothetical protein CMM57_08215 [Rhodospirillaceae bacterium]|nr:hypothetical protein [Rhodospirillaceae bacterium]
MRGKENRHHGNYGDDHLHSRDRVFVRVTSKRSWFLKESKVDEIKISKIYRSAGARLIRLISVGFRLCASPNGR